MRVRIFFNGPDRKIVTPGAFDLKDCVPNLKFAPAPY